MDLFLCERHIFTTNIASVCEHIGIELKEKNVLELKLGINKTLLIMNQNTSTEL